MARPVNTMRAPLEVSTNPPRMKTTVKTPKNIVCLRALSGKARTIKNPKTTKSAETPIDHIFFCLPAFSTMDSLEGAFIVP